MKESSEGVIRRCLVLLRCLQQGPATKTELVSDARRKLNEPYQNADGRSLDRRFERDKQKLRDLFGVELEYQRTTRQYKLIDTWEPLLNLPDTALEAMAFLQATFEPDAPQHDLVQDFLNLLASYLSPERRGDLTRQHAALAVAWGQRDDDEIDTGVERDLRRAMAQRRLIAFDYFSPSQADQAPRRHIVEPWERYFDSVRGHYYLRGYCRRTTSEAYGIVDQDRYFIYRVGRIGNLAVLPDKLPQTPPQTPRKPFIYRLMPTIARRGEVTRHPGITIQRTEIEEGGGMRVYAETDNVWWAVRSLLHYGANCEILGGREALYEMQQIVRRMAEMYDRKPVE